MTDHDLTVEQADSGWYFALCSCGWKSHRSINLNGSIELHHANHAYSEKSMEDLRREIGTS